MRLFTAVPLDEAAKDALCGAMRSLREAGVGGSWTLRENLHLTLVFIGETDRVRAAKDAVAEAVEAARPGPFDLAFEGLGYFGRSDVLWAGVARSAALAALRERMADSLAAAGFAVEARPFSPHLTLARRTGPVDLGQLGGLLPPCRSAAGGVSLMRSQRVNGRLVYTPLFTKDFRMRPEGAFDGVRR